MDLVSRRAGRVLVVDDERRVLLIHGFNPAKPEEGYWFTPGGGLEPGETTAQAAARELREETGLRADPEALIGPIYSEEIILPFADVTYRQSQDFYVLRVPEWTVDASGLDSVEVQTIDGFHWLTIDEVAAQERGPDAVYPADLSAMLRMFVS